MVRAVAVKIWNWLKFGIVCDYVHVSIKLLEEMSNLVPVLFVHQINDYDTGFSFPTLS